MEDRWQTLSARTRSALLASVVALFAVRVGAEPLDRKIPNLFGGVLSTSITPVTGNDAQRPLVADRFRGLSAALATARSQVPIPSATGAFRFEFDDEMDSYVRSAQSLGPSVAERAQTLGRRTGSVSVSYTHIDFDTLEGDRLSNVRSVQPALSAEFLAQVRPDDRALAQDNTLVTRLNLKFGYDLFFITAAYGLTESLDLSMSLSLNRARLRGIADAMIHDGFATPDNPTGNGGASFTVTQKGVIVGGSGPICSTDFLCATDSFSDSASGTGDLYLRTKWHFADTELADLATVAVLTLPTGNADNLLGFHDPTFTPWLVASKTFGRVAPHLNLGYAFRSGKDISQAQWIAGADVLASRWLTVAADFLGFHDDKRDGINDDVLQSAVGFKINPIGQLVVGGNFQFPLNRDGLRADVIYSAQLEYAF